MCDITQSSYKVGERKRCVISKLVVQSWRTTVCKRACLCPSACIVNLLCVTTPLSTGVIAREHLCWTRNQWVQGCSLMKVDSHWAENMAASAVVDIKENSMHQPMLSGVTVWAGVSSQYRIVLHLVNGTVTRQYYLNNIINLVIVPLHEQHRPDFIFMGDNTPAYQGQIIMERLLEAGVPHMEWPALPWYQLSRRVEVRNPAPQNLNDLSPSRKGECHASADNKLTCVQHETSLSSCNWCSRTLDMLLRHLLFLLWYTHHCW